MERAIGEGGEPLDRLHLAGIEKIEEALGRTNPMHLAVAKHRNLSTCLMCKIATYVRQRRWAINRGGRANITKFVVKRYHTMKQKASCDKYLRTT